MNDVTNMTGLNLTKYIFAIVFAEPTGRKHRIKVIREEVGLTFNPETYDGWLKCESERASRKLFWSHKEAVEYAKTLVKEDTIELVPTNEFGNEIRYLD